jgi:hypothetical protein
MKMHIMGRKFLYYKSTTKIQHHLISSPETVSPLEAVDYCIGVNQKSELTHLELPVYKAPNIGRIFIKGDLDFI